MTEYVNRQIKAIVDGVTWESSEMESLASIVNKDSNPQKKFSDYFYCNLSVMGIDEDTIKKVFPMEWASEETRPDSMPADQIVVTALDFEDDSVTFSFEATWNAIPISKDINSNDDFESALDWPSSLVDELWMNDEALEIVDDMDEIGIDSKTVMLAD